MPDGIKSRVICISLFIPGIGDERMEELVGRPFNAGWADITQNMGFGEGVMGLAGRLIECSRELQRAPG